MSIREIRKRGRNWYRSKLKKSYSYEDVISNIDDYDIMELQNVHQGILMYYYGHVSDVEDRKNYQKKISNLGFIIESRIRENKINDMLNGDN